NNLKEYLSWFEIRPLAQQAPSILKGQNLVKLSDARVRQALTDHVMGVSIIHDESILQAIEERFKTFHAMVYAKQDIVVTAQNPLIIKSTTAITNFGTVTLKDGGYIEIYVPVLFECDQFIKIPGGVPSPVPYDIAILGQDGASGINGVTPPKPDKAKNGSNAECDCCGGLVVSNGQPGADGQPGTVGGNAQNPTTGSKNGGNSPGCTLRLGELTGFIVMLNQGGKGGFGGNGGKGGSGGDGGDGGKDKTCGAIHASGGNGGNGGPGADGGNGGDGGSGGNGGNSIVYFRPKTSSDGIHPTNGAAEKGIGGNGGEVGSGGKGGASGGRDAKPGNDGAPGKNKGLRGQDGSPGQTGNLQLNPELA
ncbi:MAG: hypothetical protein HUU01_00930, partial [Saprospiraceae bacterium]|nr:hypothetical protein [Saprospiraceae bacterium]